MVVNDLRSALEVLRQMDGQLVETDIEVDPEAELAGVYRHVGAGGTVMRPTKIDGPAMIFNNIKNHKDARVLICLPAGNVLRNLWTAGKKNLENFCAGRL